MNLAQNHNERPQLQPAKTSRRRSRRKAALVPVATASAAPVAPRSSVELKRAESEIAANAQMEERSLAGVLLEGVSALEADPVAGILSEADSMLGLLGSLLGGDSELNFDQAYLGDVLFTLRCRLNVASELNRRSRMARMLESKSVTA
jgi:hypothetical protein